MSNIALLALLGILPSSARQNQFHIGDHGKDLDDEVACTIAGGLVHLGAVRLVGAISNLDPSEIRATIAQGTYNALGLPTPVGIGTSCNWTERERHPYQFDVSYASDPVDLWPDGPDLFFETAEHLPDGSLTLVLMSGMTDALGLLDKNEAMFLQKVGRVVLMSGIEVDRLGEPLPDDEGLLQPNKTANNTFDWDSAVALYKRLQKLGIPMTILTRDAAYAVATPRSFYDQMAATGHPVGIRLQSAQREAIEQLWRQANLPQGDPNRTLPWGPETAPRNRDWFCDTFCGGDGKDRDGSQSIWDCIKQFAQYDGLTVLAAHDDIRAELFEPVEFEAWGTKHEIIGLGKDRCGIKDPGAMVNVFEQVIMTALAGVTA